MNSCALAAFAAAMISSMVASGAAVADVLGDGAGEENAVLHDDADLPAHGLDIVARDGAVIDADLAAGRVVKAGQQRDDGALARAAGPDERDHFPRLDGEVDVIERGLPDAVTEGHVAKLDLALHAREGRQRIVLGNVRLGIEDGEDLLHRGDAVLDDGIGLEHADDRTVELAEISEEGEEFADAEFSLEDEIDAKAGGREGSRSRRAIPPWRP